MNNNSIRFDLSDWLIHFFRDIDLEGNNSILYVEHMGWGNIAEDVNWSALFMLRCAIRSGRLWATWSFRNNVRTIYGPDPAVCFTEMPIAAFLETGEKRHRRGEAMSSFALIFPKKQVFTAGANPVIYGLSNRGYWPPAGKDGGPRIIDLSILAEPEQYRYVTYNPASSKPIDWSHEREWRWPYRGDFSSVENALEEFGMVDDAMDIPGFDFYLEEIKGIGVVVNSRNQANWIAHDILMLVDKGIIDKDTFQFILASDELPSSNDLVSPADTSSAISKSLIDLKPFFSHKKKDLDDIAKEFTGMVETIEKNAPMPKAGEFGGCWLWLLDNTNIFTRALISHSRVTVSDSGKYLVHLYEFSDSRGLREREEMTEKLAQCIHEKYGVECGYFSVLNSENPNDVPFYNSDHLDNHMHYNVSWEH
ncbi:DUF4427 domain-containing protein [Rhabdochromatium marinum]|uniref:DUF4427 domain-containing protein n=1 Tax=Rhabdochromatium marinum TaxID=48729 RepID=UPI001904EF3A|nr:DUF4427 domain-containing protein [Rhabdochromatium marinum]